MVEHKQRKLMKKEQ